MCRSADVAVPAADAHLIENAGFREGILIVKFLHAFQVFGFHDHEAADIVAVVIRHHRACLHELDHARSEIGEMGLAIFVAARQHVGLVKADAQVKHGGTSFHWFCPRTSTIALRSEEHTSELQSLMSTSYAVS